MEASAGIRKRPHFDDPILELLFQRGTDHEKSYVDSLRETGMSVVELTPVMNRDELLAATLDAMRAGTDVIVQGALADEGWFGKPDLLMRVPRPSETHSSFLPAASVVRIPGIRTGHPARWHDRISPPDPFGGSGDDAKVHRSVVIGIQASSVLF